MRQKKTYNSPIFEELESRLLFSADIAEAFVTDAVVEEYVEEPAIVADLEEEPEVNVSAVGQPASEDTEVAVIELSEASINESGAPDLSAANTSEGLTLEQDPNTNREISGLNADVSQQENVARATFEAIETQKSGKANDEIPRSELVFINDTVRDKEQLIDGLLKSDNQGPLFDVFILDGAEEGISQVNSILQEYDDLDAIHFVTHGSDGQISLGNNWINNATIEEYSDTISSWGNALTENGDILFYGCNIAAGVDGPIILESISDLTGAAVAASDDITGNAVLGGDWDLELNLGEIDTRVAFSALSQHDWNHSLADPVLTLPSGDLNYTAGSGPVIIDSMATVTDVDSMNFDTGQLSVSFTSGGTTNDRLTIRNHGNSVGNISIAGSNILFHISSPPVIIGSFSGGTDGSSDLLILFNSNSTPDAVQTIVRNITYENVSAAPNTSPRTLKFDLQDGDGGTASFSRDIIFSGANNSPIITSDGGGVSANITVPENTSAVTTVTATDVDGDGPVFVISGGADQALFEVTAGGVVSFIGGQDFESPADNDTNGVYEVEVSVYDGEGGSDMQTILVTITDTNEKPTLVTLSPTSIDEGIDTSGGFTLGSLNTIDQDTDDTFTYTLIGGADAGVFTLSSNTVILTDGVLDFEKKPSYEVALQVTDSLGLTHSQTFTINVNDIKVAPPGDAPIPANITIENTPGTSINDTPQTSHSDHKDSIDSNIDYEARIEENTQFPEEEVILGNLFSDNTKTTPETMGQGGKLIDPSAVEKNNPEFGGGKFAKGLTDAQKEDLSEKDTGEINHKKLESLAEEPLAEYYSPEKSPLGTKAEQTPTHFTLATMKDYSKLLLGNYIKNQNEESAKGNQAAKSLFPAHLQSASPVDFEAANEALRLEIKHLHEDMDKTFEEEEAKYKTSVYVSGGAAFSLSAGIASYLLRAGSMISSFLSTVPLWKGFDPVAVLPTHKKRDNEDQQQQSKCQRLFNEK